MSWSFEIARIRGIAIKVHVTFVLVVFLFAWQWADITGTFAGALFGIALVLLLFVCVTLHELGHSLVAQRYGIPVRQITLLPLGGVAQISKNPDSALHELLIAAAGPLVNVVIALVLALVLGSQSQLSLLTGRGLLNGELNQPTLLNLLVWLTAANVSLALFNLIPAFPLDGGRMFRALLAMALGYPRATRIAAVVGELLAIGLAVVAFMAGDWVLVLIAVFIFVGAGQETAVASSKTVLSTQKLGDAYNKNALTLVIGDRVSKAVDYILTSYQPDFAVMQGSKLLGIVTRNDVLNSLATNPDDLYVQQIMQRDVQKLDAGQTLEEARALLNEKGKRIGAVYQGETYLGLVSLEDIAEAFTVLTFWNRQQKLRQAKQAGPAGQVGPT
jgi:Zn-dependent protease/predicted transcriptional regulator